ncbi:MAG: VOC family protein [Planctomycetota bacterium]
MSDPQIENQRIVWFDMPVTDLDRAIAFYREVLAIQIDKESFENFTFAVLEHGPGNGGCLIPDPEHKPTDSGPLMYFGVEGRLPDAVEKTRAHGGEVVQDTHPIGPHGFRAIVRDSEGNRIALHSETNSGRVRGSGG